MDKWAESLQSEALDTRDRHIMTTEDQAGIDTEHAEADTLNSNERDAKDQSTALRKQLDQLRRELAVAQEQQDHRMADHALEEGLRQKRMQALRTAVSVYSTRLGLEFKQGPEELELVFTQIDTHDPERQFCFAVRILPDNSYQVTRCQPEVEQNHHNFPRVERDLGQLQQFADTLLGRTKRYRTIGSQNAASRLLAEQGFDTTRLAQDVTTLAVQPAAAENVFTAAGSSSVEEYLQQVEESTILAAIQEAQSETVESFQSYMEGCMASDWAANKRTLFSLLAPHNGSSGFSGFSSQGVGGRTPLIGGSPLPAGMGGGSVSRARSNPMGLGTAQLHPMERAYVEVVQQSHAATGNFDLVGAFAAACEAKDDRTHETRMSSCWALLGDILKETRRSEAAPTSAIFTEALLTGARKHLETGHTVHTRNHIKGHKQQAERGPDPSDLKEVQAYLAIKLKNRGLLDFQAAGGHDTCWIQVYFCLRNGKREAALAAAAAATIDNGLLKQLGSQGLAPILEEWYRNSRALSDHSALLLAREGEKLLRDKASLKSQLRFPYLVLLCGLLSGEARIVEGLTSALTGMQAPQVLTTLEDFMWAKLCMIAPPASPGTVSNLAAGYSSGPPSYSLAEFQTDLNRWPPTYYSRTGKEPLLYVTVLLLSLQIGTAIKYLWTDESTRSYRCDAVHLAYAMQKERMLTPHGSSPTNVNPTADIALMLHQWGRKMLPLDSSAALSYYMTSAKAQGNSLVVKAQLLKELLIESNDFGTMLGGGGSGSRGLLDSYVTDPLERRRLYEAVAYECQVSAQSEEAIELYLAAERPRQALAILNQQLSALIGAAIEQTATGTGRASAAEDLQRLEVKAGCAVERIGDVDTADDGSAAEVAAFRLLVIIKQALLAERRGNHAMALHCIADLGFIPFASSSVDRLIQRASQLHPAVAERLADVIEAAADALAGQQQGASRDKRFTLKLQLEALLTYANGVSLRVGKSLFQKLAATAASFS
ncbi:MAG: hypothetical protein WDW36_003029 [Sanguina aurantia]